MKIICLLRTIKYSIQRWLEVGFDGIIIEGHNYIEQKNGELKCEVCGKIEKQKVGKIKREK